MVGEEAVLAEALVGAGEGVSEALGEDRLVVAVRAEVGDNASTDRWVL